jgi:hypothetical protein
MRYAASGEKGMKGIEAQSLIGVGGCGVRVGVSAAEACIERSVGNRV